ncbi:MAG: hypothetical protein HQK83_07800 [Fibrobacteria bacterium]|nr:hypothetical protein [Fibrobacteria bacterium]
MQNRARILLYESFDRELNDSEHKELEQNLVVNDELRREQQDLQKLREKIKNAKTPSFNPFFVEQTMDKLFSSVTQSRAFNWFDSLFSSFWRVGVAAAAACLILVVLNLKNVSINQNTQQVSTNNESLEEMFEQVSLQMVEDEL